MQNTFEVPKITFWQCQEKILYMAHGWLKSAKIVEFRFWFDLISDPAQDFKIGFNIFLRALF